MAVTKNNYQVGFTLIEMAIVLVIIGLIVGGVLVGQDLIRAAALRAQVTQIEKYNQAVNTFRGKYGALPGDLNSAVANQFGFSARGSGPGEGDGNGIVEGYAAGYACGFCALEGETAIFWIDLTIANGLNVNLIDGSFNTASILAVPPVTTGTGINLYFPQAKIGNGNYIYVWSGGQNLGWGSSGDRNSDNQDYYGLSAVTQLGGGAAPWQTISNPGLTVQQAYSIDTKMDDGLPQSGSVKAMYLNGNLNAYGPSWAAGGGVAGIAPGGSAAASATSCYDNGSNAANPMQYSVEISNGSNINCALSFRFQ